MLKRGLLPFREKLVVQQFHDFSSNQNIIQIVTYAHLKPLSLLTILVVTEASAVKRVKTVSMDYLI